MKQPHLQSMDRWECMARRLLVRLLAALLIILAAAQADAAAALTAPLTVAEREAMVQDFVAFVKVFTESAEGGKEDKIPSTDGQRDMSVMLSKWLPWPRAEVDGPLVIFNAELDVCRCLPVSAQL